MEENNKLYDELYNLSEDIYWDIFTYYNND